ncbi:MAG: HAD-IIA family hydrolase [Asgard group archaeon]|nr:HAD-IIA family hydrolase [Asgard group archaeon]
MEVILNKIQLFIFDVDGTLLLGSQPLLYATKVLELLKEKEMDFVIISNNSSYSPEENKQRLEETLDIELDYSNLFTSIQASIEYLKKKNISSSYIVGAPLMVEEFKRNGIEQNSENPEAIVLGYDKTLTYDKIKTVALLLQRDKRIPFYATHADKTCPTDDGKIPDVGSFLKMFKEATNRTPDMVFGKPNDIMIKLSMKGRDIKKSEVLIIGDRLETDIQMANIASTYSALVLTGDSNEKDAYESNFKPTFIWKNLEFLYDFLKNN